MEAATYNPLENVRLMNKALQSEGVENKQQVQEVHGQEAREVENLDMKEKRRLTFLGQDPLYQHLMWQMGLIPAMVDEYNSYMHQEMIRCYESSYVLTQEEVEEGANIPNQEGSEDPVAEAGKYRETGTQTTMVDAEAARIKMALAEKTKQMKTIHQKLIAITEIMIQNQRAREMEAMTQETDQGDSEVPDLSSKC